MLSVKPKEVLSHEPTPVLIKAENLPAEIQVLFNGQPVKSPPPICRPSSGEVDVTTPTGLVGDIEIRVQDENNHQNFGTAQIRFKIREIPLPYRDYIDGSLLKKERTDRKLTQNQVSEQTNINPTYISQAENRGCSNNDVYKKLAEFYEKPLSDFLKPGVFDD